jgi:hypothetical protein
MPGTCTGVCVPGPCFLGLCPFRPSRPSPFGKLYLCPKEAYALPTQALSLDLWSKHISTPVTSCTNGGINALHPRPSINAYQAEVPSLRRIPTLALRPAVMVPVDGTDSGSCGGRWNTTGTDGRRRHHPATEASLLGVPWTRIDSSSSPSSATCKVPLSFLAYSSR